MKEFDIRLVSIEGGLKVNAITRESDFEIAVKDTDAFLGWFDSVKQEFAIQYEFSDAGLNFITEVSTTNKALSAKDSQRIIDLLFMLPYGVIQKSKVIEDLVITSANVGTVVLDEKSLKIEVSLRATQTFVIENIMTSVQFLCDTLGFTLEFSAKYPGWNYDVNSKFRKHLLAVFKEMRGAEMDVVATHGGLELGIWKDKLPQLDIVSFGPIMFDIHTPQERLDLASFDRTYEFMVKVLKDLKSF